MQEGLLYTLALILVLGTAAQWLGWRFGIPSILLLLGTGLVAGPLLGFLDVEAFEPFVLPLASLGVAVILFEGGLSLNLKELKQSGGTIGRLVSLGALVSLGLAAVAAHYILGFDWGVALLFGAVLVITGPTVIMPMLRQIRPRGRINHVLKWEGIVNDPVGAVLAVLILEVMLAGQVANAPGIIALGIGKTLLVGIVGSVIGAWLLVLAFQKHWIPDFLHNPVTLAVVIGSFVLSNAVQKESGLLTVTLMGVLLANQRSFRVRHIIEFKENLQVLLIAGLFVLLSARVDAEVLASIGIPSVLFILAMVLVVRPVSVLAATVGTSLNWRERVFLMLMAPRGIVVTALASLFAFSLPEALGQRMFAETLFVVIGTVAFYGLVAGPASKWLKLANPSPKGILIVGAQPFARMLAVTAQKHGVSTVLMDSNEGNVEAARSAGLKAFAGNIHSEEFLESVDFSDVGTILALTANDEVNAFALEELAKFVGRANVYALPQRRRNRSKAEDRDRNPDALFGREITFGWLNERFYRGAVIRSVEVTEEIEWIALCETQSIRGVPLMVARPDENVSIRTHANPIQNLKKGSTVLYLTEPPAKSLDASQ